MAKIIDAHFADEAKPFTVEPGKTIEEIVRACDIPEGIWLNVVIILNGTEIVREEWANVFPVDSDVLSIHVVPLGGGDGKSILRLVAVIAVAIAAPQLVAAAGLTGTTATVATAALTVVGTLAVNALIPPPTIRPNVPGGSATSNAYFLSGQSNRARPYEIVPVTYGTHKIFANVASAPHIFSAGTSSIFQGLYDFGVGGYQVSNIVAGTTPLNLFKNQSNKLHTFKPDPYTASSTSAFKPVDLEIYNFPFKSTDLSIGLNELGDQGIATTHPEAHTAVLEISFPAGLTYFDDTGNNQGTYVKFYASYRQSGSGTFLPLPRETKGFAGDDHLGFRGIDSVGGNPPGPIDPGGDPIYEARIGAGPVSLGVGDKTWVYVDFMNGNPAYYGNGYSSTNPERPKESFWWENIDTGEVYRTSSTFNGLSQSEYDPSEWAYNQRPDALNGYTDVGPTAAMGTMVMDNPGPNTARYAFEFVAPNVQGRWRLKMDLYEWWRLPYEEIGNTRIADSQGTFQYATSTQGAPVTFTTTAPVVVPSGEIFNDQKQSEYSYILTSVYGPSSDGPWTVTPPTINELFWFKGGLYAYDFDTQGDLVLNRCFGTVMKVANEAITFSGYSADGYLAVKEAETEQLISQGVLRKVFQHSRMSEVAPAFININPNWGDNWPGVDDTEEDANGTYFKVYGNEATPGIVSLVVPLPSAGSYDFRVSRYMDAKAASADAGDEVNESRYVDSAVWSRLGSRGLPSDTAVLDLQYRHTLLELEFEANESIAGNVQEISATIRPYLRTLRSNGSFYGPALTDANGDTAYDNPAWVVLDILTGWTIQNKRAPRFRDDHCGWLTPDQLDLGSFYDFAQYCNQRVSYTSYAGTAQRKRYATNLVMASDAPVIETVQNILGQCRAQLIINQAGKISIMRDEARNTPRQLFTPSNSWDFSGGRSFTEIPHCFNVQFTSPELGWQQATVKVYRPGYDATGSGSNQVASVFEDLDTIGITNAHQAQLYGSYMLAQAVIRNESFTLSTDVENLVCQRGDLVEVAHDAPLMGGRSAVITGEVGGWLHISEAFDGLTADTNTYTLRTNDGDIRYGSVTAINGNEVKITNQSQADVGGLIVIGPSNRVTESYLIQGIRPKPDLTAEITLVKYDARVYEVDSGQFPVWNPNFNENISTGGRYTAYSVTGASTLIYQERQPYTEAVINWLVSPDNDSVAGFFVEYQTAGGPRRELDYVSGGTRTYKHVYSSRDTAWGSQTVYFITPYSSLGYRGSEGRITLSKRVDATPPTVSGFAATFTDNGNTRFTWDDAVDPDIEAFSIYYKPDPINPGFGGEKIAQPSYDKTDWVIEGASEGLYWIVATDTSGNNSDPSVDGSYDVGAYPTPGAVQNFRLWIDQGIGVLRWDLLDDPSIVQYQLRYHEDTDFTDGDLAAEYGITSANTNSFASEKLQGSFFIRAKNRWNVYGPWTRTDSVFEGLAIFNENLTQELRFVNRFPFSDVTIRWSVTGDPSLISRYRVFFYPTDPDVVIRDTETAAERPPVLIYEGQERQCVTTVATTEDTGRQHGVFVIQVISIYGIPGEEAEIEFSVLRDTTPPAAPEGFFVNIVGNTNADIAWIASQSIDVDRYELRYTPNVDSPRWEAAEHLATVGYDVTGYQTNARTGSYLLQVIDTSGNKSEVLIQRTTVAELPDMNVVEVIEESPDWLGKKIYFGTEGGRLITEDAPYTGGDEFGAEPYRESFYYYAEQVDLGDIYETRITAKLEAYGQLGNTFMVDWNPLSSVDPIAGVEENEDWDCWVEYRAGTNADVIADWPTMAEIDPIAGNVADDWTPWRRFLAADVTARFLQFRIIARGYHPEAEVSVIQSRVEVDMPDRYWTKADVPVAVGGTSINIDPPFRHIEAISVTVDGNDYNVRAVVSDKDPAGFKVTLIDQPSGDSVAGQVDVFVSGYGIQRTAII